MVVLGVDGRRGRWVGALLDGRTVRLLERVSVAATGGVTDPEVTARGLAQRAAAPRRVVDVDAALPAAPPRVPAVDARGRPVRNSW